MYFWRNYAQSEVDLVERTSLGLSAFEFKWGIKRLAKTPKFFKDSYKLESQTVNPDNFENFI
jgi:hypothetical protein